MEILQIEENGIVFIFIKGRLDVDLVLEVEKVVKEVFECQMNCFLFNLKVFEYFSSVGFRVLLSVVKEMRCRDGKIVFCVLNEFVREIFEVSGF